MGIAIFLFGSILCGAAQVGVLMISLYIYILLIDSVYLEHDMANSMPGNSRYRRRWCECFIL